jgi:uncharacterized protein
MAGEGHLHRPLMDADAVELRVLGCLIEKQRTTPDVYPLSLNTLRLACNQSTNRDPVVDYDEPTIRAALEKLSRRSWVRLASGAGSRAIKYRHLLDEALELSPGELSLLTVLMLRGPQTPGELNQRTQRLHPFAGLDDVHATLDALSSRGLAERLERRPGQKEDRYRHLLSGADAATDDADELSEAAVPATDLEERLAALEREVADLRAALAELGPRDRVAPVTPGG